MRIALAQLNPLIGDLEGNAERILQACAVAAAAGAELVLTPELSLWGYPPRDLLLRDPAMQRQQRLLDALPQALPIGLQLLVGMADPVPGEGTPRLWNALALLRGGGGPWSVVARKRLLPSYDVFDESRYFIAGREAALLTLVPGPPSAPTPPADQNQPSDQKAWRLGLSICEDLWVEQELQGVRVAGVDPIGELAAQGLDLLLNLSASPYGRGKLALRRRLAARAARRACCTLLYLNQVGGNDELVFDGGSFAIGADGTPLWQAACGREQLILWEAGQPGQPAVELELPDPSAAGLVARRPPEPAPQRPQPGDLAASPQPSPHPQLSLDPQPARRPGHPLIALATTPEATAAPAAPAGLPQGEAAAAIEHRALIAVPEESEQLLRALVLGVRDYARKCGFQGALLGLSGGIDSALVAVIACAALGASRVKALRLPSPWSSQGSLDDADALAQRLQLPIQTLPISALMQGFEAALTPVLGQIPSGVTAENLQSRIRGTLLMAIANQSGALLLSTGNKSELAVGYCTLYGDMNGGLSVIGDLYKTTVFSLCDWIDSDAAAACRSELGLPATGELIGAAIRQKPPSAELRPDQRDSDTLPDYAVLDALLRRYIETMATPEQLIHEGADPELALRVFQLLRRAEFKRRQVAPVLKISSRSFGGGWRMPIAAGG